MRSNRLLATALILATTWCACARSAASERAAPPSAAPTASATIPSTPMPAPPPVVDTSVAAPADAAPSAPTCVSDPPGPCEMRLWSGSNPAPWVHEYAYVERRLVLDRSHREGAAGVFEHRYQYDARGLLVLDETFHDGVRAWSGRYRRDAHGNVLELRSQLEGSPERQERHVLTLDPAGRVLRDERWALPDGVIFGPPLSARRVRRTQTNVYERDAQGRVLVEREELEGGPLRAIYFERDAHGGVVRTRTEWPGRGTSTEARVRRTYDECGNELTVEQLERDGSVRERWERRYDCPGFAAAR